MVRQRKTVKISTNNANIETSSSSSSEGSASGRKRFHILSAWKTAAGVVCFCIAVLIGVIGYLETRVNTPFYDKKIVHDGIKGPAVPERFWGTYRPGLYLGLKSREPTSPVFGLMWYEMSSSHKGIRHWCKQEDNLPTYGWLRHNGDTFGEQLILDPPYYIHTSFIKNAAASGATQWTVRLNVTAQNKVKSPLMLLWYGALDEGGGQLWAERGSILGHTNMHPNFRVSFHTVHGKVLHTSQTEAHVDGLNNLNDKIYSLLQAEPHPGLGRIAVLAPDPVLNEKGKEVNFVPVQMLVEAPYVVDIVYTCEGAPPALKLDDYGGALLQERQVFDKRFEDSFNLSAKGYSSEDVGIAKAAMSNMVGGIGYFYGAGRVQSQHTKEPVPYWRAELYTAVPSRSFFPRGFLWDEGFHGLLIGRWNPSIMIDIAAHWLDLINVEGWIPREQILGSEALARVPKEYVVQSNAHANPPMLLITLARMLQLHPTLLTPHRAMLARMLPRLQAWYNWFQTTQKGEEPTSYRWRGREDDGRQLNPKSLSSGLDDYPRASHPSDVERHVDLRCWMYAAADALATIANALQLDSSKYESMRAQLADEKLLNELHWSSHTQTYADYGLHSEGVKLVRQHSKPGAPGGARVVRSVSVPPQPRFVTSAYGYVSLFPMLLKVLEPNSDKLGKMLQTLDNPDLMWSPYGLRSLSKSSPFYMRRNTEHDPPYWRGQVWLNINYLALSALKHYARTDCAHAHRAAELHQKLRDNIVRTILSEYKRTGYLWEQYSDSDGKGSGCRPFTGWTALIVLIMAEDY